MLLWVSFSDLRMVKITPSQSHPTMATGELSNFQFEESLVFKKIHSSVNKVNSRIGKFIRTKWLY